MSFGPDTILSFVLIVYSIVLHEIAHGYAALKFGDDTAERADRLTLNPLNHIDPMGTIIFPLIQLLSLHGVYIGWAKPVPVQVHRLEPRVAGEIVVSVAGVTVNFAIAVAMAILLGFDAIAPLDRSIFNVLFGVMQANIGLAIFNLVPIPPLDGSHVLKHVLPPPLREPYEQVGFYGTFILLILSYSGMLDPVIGPPIRAISRFLFANISLRMRGMV